MTLANLEMVSLLLITAAPTALASPFPLSEDELQFRTACLRLALSVLHVRTQNYAEVSERSKAVRSWWDYDPQHAQCQDTREPSASVSEDLLTERTISRFCRTGLMDDDQWSRLSSETTGHTKYVSLQEELSAVWLGPGLRTECNLKDKFAWLTDNNGMAFSGTRAYWRCYTRNKSPGPYQIPIARTGLPLDCAVTAVLYSQSPLSSGRQIRTAHKVQSHYVSVTVSILRIPDTVTPRSL
ncbi:Hypothetical protein SMAX5B_008369 [Scophthalmus maximus]|uniref:Uncharacterized protein n=1 Tax=Scophthalmus maximus TaxID=52904 RepID=A0A2U9CUN1_SCOMX|nr:Hypothetical protein SMAX5B_008369 [Scophthalmus maximus]